MGYQIAKQPDGRYMVFSTVSDTVCAYDATREEVINYFVKMAEERARQDTEQWLKEVDQGGRRFGSSRSYRQMLKDHQAGNCGDKEWNKEIAKLRQSLLTPDEDEDED